MRAGFSISVIGHVSLLAWSVITFAPRPLDAKQIENLPVDVISDKEFSEITSGVKNAKQAEKPKPLVEKIAEKNPVEDPASKVSEKKEIKAAKDDTPPPPPPKPEVKQEEKKPEPKVDEIAEALKREPAKTPPPPQKQVEMKPVPVPPQPPKRPPRPDAKFDPTQVAALLDKQAPRRQAAAGETLNAAPALGLAHGQSASLSQSELDALKARLAQLWSPPAGAKDPSELVVVVRVQLGRDGRLSGPPIVMTSGTSQLFMASRDSAARALLLGQPYTMLRPEHYDMWKDIEITFDPREMFPGG
jgi:outer membrane biosynthesis protein TonB